MLSCQILCGFDGYSNTRELADFYTCAAILLLHDVSRGLHQFVNNGEFFQKQMLRQQTKQKTRTPRELMRTRVQVRQGWSRSLVHLRSELHLLLGSAIPVRIDQLF